MKRFRPLRPGKPMKRGPGPKRTNKRKPATVRRGRERRAREFARVYGSQERVEKIKLLPCYVCGKEPAENAHTANGGKGRKADWDTVADVGAKCHRTDADSIHGLGSVDAFDAMHGTDLRLRARFLAEWIDADGNERWSAAEAAALWTRYQGER